MPSKHASSSTHSPNVERSRRTGPREISSGWLIAVLAAAGTVVSLQGTLILPLLPEFPRLLDTTTEAASWLITVTLLSGAVATPTISRIADMYGKKRMMLLSLGVMITGSLIGALGVSLPLLLLARALQGVGVAIIPIGIALMRDELPEDRVPLGVALMSATLAIGAGAGLPLAGLIAEHLPWYFIFWLPAGVGSILFICIWLFVSESPIHIGGTFDYFGALLLSCALTSLLLALTQGSGWGWTSAPVTSLVVLGLITLAVFLAWEVRVPTPLVDVRVAARPMMVLLNLGSVLMGFAMFGNMLVTTQQLQLPTSTGYGLGLGVLAAGLWMAPIALVFGAVAPIAAALTNKIGAVPTLILGSLWMAIGYVVRVFMSHELWMIALSSTSVAAGTALTFSAMPTLVTRAAPITETASANGVNVLLRSVGSSTASSVTAAIAALSVNRIGGNGYPSEASMHAVLWISAAACVGTACLSLPMLRLRSEARSDLHPVVLATSPGMPGEIVPVIASTDPFEGNRHSARDPRTANEFGRYDMR